MIKLGISIMLLYFCDWRIHKSINSGQFWQQYICGTGLAIKFEFKLQRLNFNNHMPSQVTQKPNTRLPLQKSKIITKNQKKNKIQPQFVSPEKDYTDQNTIADSPTTNDQPERKVYSNCLILMLIKHLHSALHYGKDTLYVCLHLLNRLKIQIDQHKCKLYAAAILQMAAKVHEYRTPRYSDLVAWGNYIFKREDIVAIQGQLLFYFNFKIPTALNFKSIRHVEEAIRHLEMQIEAPQASYTFQ